jgi:hypothetical protein
VHGELGYHLSQPRSVPGRDPRADGEVNEGAPGRHEPVIQHLTVHLVSKPVSGGQSAVGPFGGARMAQQRTFAR